jgi:hypothetical protein
MEGYMPEWFTTLAAVVALFGGIFGAVNGYRSMKRTSPVEEVRKENHDRWKAFYNDKWDKLVERVDKAEEMLEHVDSDQTRKHFREIDDKLDNDHRRIGAIIETTKSQQRFLVLMLKSQQQALVHLADGNHRASLTALSEEITAFLLSEATRCDL